MVARGALGSIFAVAQFTEPHLSLVETLQVEKIYGRSFASVLIRKVEQCLWGAEVSAWEWS